MSDLVTLAASPYFVETESTSSRNHSPAVGKRCGRGDSSRSASRAVHGRVAGIEELEGLYQTAMGRPWRSSTASTSSLLKREAS
jgi:hypothetical protein